MIVLPRLLRHRQVLLPNLHVALVHHGFHGVPDVHASLKIQPHVFAEPVAVAVTAVVERVAVSGVAERVVVAAVAEPVAVAVAELVAMAAVADLHELRRAETVVATAAVAAAVSAAVAATVRWTSL